MLCLLYFPQRQRKLSLKQANSILKQKKSTVLKESFSGVHQFSTTVKLSSRKQQELSRIKKSPYEMRIRLRNQFSQGHSKMINCHSMILSSNDSFPGVQLSWESATLAAQRSGVRAPLSPYYNLKEVVKTLTGLFCLNVLTIFFVIQV